jgi:aldehyde:ferredoxin oxidoreductase
MKGYNGRILRVNLTAGQFSTEEPSEDYYKLYLGGRGFIVHTLLTELPQGIDPLGPENKLIWRVRRERSRGVLGCGAKKVRV